MADIEDKHIKEFKGEVVSAKADKTIVVEIDNTKQHPLYKKRYTEQNKFYAHDEENKASEGDEVIIREDRPRSKKKRWKLVEIV